MKAKIFILIVFSCLLFAFHISIGFSQQVQQEWVQTFHGTGESGDMPSSLTVDSSGNIYVTGGLFMSPQNTNFCTIKYNTNGDQQWVAIYNGPGSNSIDVATAIAVDKQGNVYVTGHSEETGFLTDAYCTIKYNSTGNQQWVSRYKYLSNGQDIAKSIAVDDSNNVYVIGYSQISSTGFEYCTIKYKPNGDSAWVRRYNNYDINSQNWAYSLCLDKTDNVYITGFVRTSNATNAGTIKYNSNGTIQWVSVYNNPSSARKIIVDDTANVYITGSTSTGVNTDFLTIKYNSNGIQQWVNTYNGIGNSTDISYDIGISKWGDCFVTGYVNLPGNTNDYCTIKYSNSGIQQWVNTYNGPGNGNDESYSLVVDNDGSVYITGRSFGVTGNYEFATIKYNNSGIQQWSIRYPYGSGTFNGHGISLDNFNNVIVFGVGMPGVGGPGIGYCTIKYNQLVGIKKKTKSIISKFELYQNYPNPFNSQTRIDYDLATRASVQLNVYDILGRLTETIVNKEQNQGTYDINWNASDFSSGIYFYQLIADGNIIDIKKMILLK